MRNLELFIDDHPELGLDKENILTQAKKHADKEDGLMVANVAELLFGPAIAPFFFGELQSLKHVRAFVLGKDSPE